MGVLLYGAGRRTRKLGHRLDLRHLGQPSDSNTAGIGYMYDGNGLRVKKTVGSFSMFYFYAEGMGLISEFTTTTGATGASSSDRTTVRT